MRFRAIGLLGLFCFIGMLINGPALATRPSLSTLPPAVAPTITIPAVPTLAATSFVLMDYLSGDVLVKQADDQRVEPASLTKMMTVYLSDQALKDGRIKPSDQVKISEFAWRAPGSRMFLEINTEVSIEDLRRGVIIQSGNDASIALAEHVAGSEAAFVDCMNETAKTLGMVNTHFMNASGLPDPNHYTTAHDMALLARAVIRDFPETYALYAEKEFTYNNIRQENRNRLLWRNALVDGIKTGHTDSAGYCLVASGKKDQTRLIAVLMGAENDKHRIEESNTLINYGFRFFETKKLYSANTALQQARVWLGKHKTVDLGLVEDCYITEKVGGAAIQATIDVSGVIKAPLQSGRVLGTLRLSRENQVIAERPIIALSDVPEAGFFSRMWDTLCLGFHQLREKFGF
jgi:serine-type D-Ala-D-Ala carboxypeptidase (penicillin-binding protein 5/6)